MAIVLGQGLVWARRVFHNRCLQGYSVLQLAPLPPWRCELVYGLVPRTGRGQSQPDECHECGSTRSFDARFCPALVEVSPNQMNARARRCLRLGTSCPACPYIAYYQYELLIIYMTIPVIRMNATNSGALVASTHVFCSSFANFIRGPVTSVIRWQRATQSVHCVLPTRVANHLHHYSINSLLTRSIPMRGSYGVESKDTFPLFISILHMHGR